MPSYPADQDGQRDAPNVKVENNQLPLVDQAMWNIELVEHMREVTEPYTGDHGQEISVQILVPRDDQLAKWKAYRELRAKYDKPPNDKHKIKHALHSVLESFAILNPLYAWELLNKEDAE